MESRTHSSLSFATARSTICQSQTGSRIDYSCRTDVLLYVQFIYIYEMRTIRDHTQAPTHHGGVRGASNRTAKSAVSITAMRWMPSSQLIQCCAAAPSRCWQSTTTTMGPVWGDCPCPAPSVAYRYQRVRHAYDDRHFSLPLLQAPRTLGSLLFSTRLFALFQQHSQGTDITALRPNPSKTKTLFILHCCQSRTNCSGKLREERYQIRVSMDMDKVKVSVFLGVISWKGYTRLTSTGD